MVTNSVLGARIAEGRTAEIFAWRDHQVLKLYHEWCPPEWIEYELKIARITQNLGLPVPAVGEIVAVNARRGLVYERIEGVSLNETLNTKPWELFRGVRVLADLHAAIHGCAAPELPSQREGFARSIRNAPALPADLKSAALRALDAMPDGDQLCHGDFHPGNVLMTARGPIVIDWMTAKRGNPIADVARTLLLLTTGEPSNAFARWLVARVRELIKSCYLRQYDEHRALDPAQLARWMPIVAAARLNENIVEERDQVLAIVKAGL
ncbi:MAG: phosphotransferase [Chloroflexi bacterium]|nr:phosphotransferase [Chloroflexota bacterium]